MLLGKAQARELLTDPAQAQLPHIRVGVMASLLVSGLRVPLTGGFV